ncbi:heme ABC exporter ATP-binding protein CcmA [Rhodobacteraceae bacterium Araon29]|mgnify:FL=1|tara:strand:+ start:1996 stop:2616 length:621 start_codon:yes stop_codon:yes gene_type:complete
MLLSVSDVSVSRGGRVLLEGVTFDLQAGRAIVLTGKNGIGKTSLLRTLAGLQDANSGYVDVPQNGVVYSAHLDGIKHALSVAENLQFWGAVFGRSNVDTALETFELYHLRDVMAGALSAGQKRRLGLARLLVTGRSIWLLDEPTVSLDLGSIKQLTRVLNEHLGAGGSTIIATHSALDLKGQEVTIDLGKFAATKTGLSASEEAFL